MTNQDTFAVRTGLTQITFGARVLGRRHHFHGLRDFLNVLDGLQTHGNVLERGHGTVLLLRGGGAFPENENDYDSTTSDTAASVSSDRETILTGRPVSSCWKSSSWRWRVRGTMADSNARDRSFDGAERFGAAAADVRVGGDGCTCSGRWRG